MGTPIEAVDLVRKQVNEPFGSYQMTVDGDPGFAVDALELVYRVRWDVPPEEIRPVGRPTVNPGDTEAVRYDAPGWIVDRVTRDVYPFDLAGPTVESFVGARRVYPLPRDGCSKAGGRSRTASPRSCPLPRRRHSRRPSRRRRPGTRRCWPPRRGPTS
ncbi:hypothetical protein Prum_054830 [Phytohabitans rumicis]|uniref:Uncharacterized protein n=1 Tax=Phytohabitans rumicis TaxID=1076125 RepID=A0A6V8LAN9_9ACTN|nr:hypothetical protein Prum_054830 [Phytohabitans rumicis]